MEMYKTLDNGLFCSIDWLSFTVLDCSDLQSCLNTFGFNLSDFYDCPRGANGYKNMLSYICFNIRVLYNGNENMGIHFDISGSAVSEFYRVYYESCYDISTPWGTLAIDFSLDVVNSLFSKILKMGHITRLDLAIDNKHDLFYSVKELHDILDCQRFVSKWRSWRYVEEKETSGVCSGRSIYFGSRSSDIMLRVYDKELEQNKKYPNKDHLKHVNYKWVRWELELKNERANMAIDKLINGVSVGELAIGILSNYFRIINFDDNNKSRCSNDIKWERFVDDIHALRLYIAPLDNDLNDKKDWLIRQCAPTIAAVIMSDYGDMSFLSECIDVHACRMNNKLQALVSAKNPDWKKQLDLFCSN